MIYRRYNLRPFLHYLSVCLVTLTTAPVVQGAIADQTAECRSHIQTIVCMAEPAEENDTPETRKCLRSPEYAKFFEDLFDSYPQHLRQMFCHLEKIFVERSLQGSAYAGVFYDKKNPKRIRSGYIGIRQTLLDHSSQPQEWASWKEQLSFGVRIDKIEVKAHLPTVDTSHTGIRDLLFLIVTHEFGHLFDFTNELNRFDNCSGPYGDRIGKCTSTPGSWSNLSWMTYLKPYPLNDFPLRSSLCFYFCKGIYLREDQQSELFADLRSTNFLTPYAARSPSEDFAESFLYYHISKYRQSTYRIRFERGEIDVIGKLHSPIFQPKLEFINSLLAGKLRYPGD